MPTDSFRESAYAPQTDVVWHNLLEVYFRKDDGTIFRGYYVNDYLPVYSRGVVYQPSAFNISLGSAISNEVPRSKLEFDSGDRQVISELRANKNHPIINLSVVTSVNPDIIEIGPVKFSVDGFTIKATSVSMDLTVEPILNEPIPSAKFTPTIAAGLWRNIT